MEYTKDVIFNVHYKNKIGTIKLGKSRWKKGLLKILKQNKFITSIISSLVILIAIDIILVNNFIRLLTTI